MAPQPYTHNTIHSIDIQVSFFNVRIDIYTAENTWVEKRISKMRYEWVPDLQFTVRYHYVIAGSAQVLGQVETSKQQVR